VSGPLVPAETALALDREASASWGFSPFALVEAAGRACADALIALAENRSRRFRRRPLPRTAAPRRATLALAGPGNNGADALVMLRSLVMKGFAAETESAVILSKAPPEGEKTPRSESITALRAMGIPVHIWDGSGAADRFTLEGLLDNADIVIDGVAGTGLRGELRGPSLELVQAINGRALGKTGTRPLAVSIDVPSGCRDDISGGAGPVVRADITLAIEPLKQCLYTPSLRPHCGRIVPIEGIFPERLLRACIGGGSVSMPHPEQPPFFSSPASLQPGTPQQALRSGLPLPPSVQLAAWNEARRLIPPVPPGAHKYKRGLAEIHAGDYGSCGAARIAAEGAQAAGAGMVRLVADDELYPVLAAGSGGVMAVPASRAAQDAAAGRFRFDALLLGPGWGTKEQRFAVLEQAMDAETRGVPLILDADAIALTKEYCARKNAAPRFHGRAALTPHAGELERFTGVPKERLLAEPALLAERADALNAVIVFKSHVTLVAAPGYPPVYVDGMNGALAAGGSGDLLAGFFAGIAARLYALKGTAFGPADLRDAAVAAVCLLAESARRRVFGDPLDIARRAVRLAGAAWLKPHGKFQEGYDAAG
jgi:NAD(P)H-hydrate epimerase